MKCCVQNCVNSGKVKIKQPSTSTNKRITYHFFPRDPIQQEKWLESLALSNLMLTNRTFICSNHFKEDDFYITKQRTRRIKNGVVPFIQDDCCEPAALRCRDLICGSHKMADNFRRKCFKCGLSPNPDDQNIKLYRFPKPGTTNMRRCEMWAKYCFPDKLWSSADFQRKLHSEHRMLCNKHFKDSEFNNIEEKKLSKHAVPDMIEFDEVIDAQPMKKPCNNNIQVSKVCKLCLSVDSKMYQVRDHGLDKMYEEIMGIPPRMDAQNRLPMGICWECTARLQSASAFRSKALFSDALLQDHLKNNADIKIIDIQNLLQCHTKLKSTISIQEVFKFNSHNIEEHAPNTYMKTEIIRIPDNEETEVDVNDLVRDKNTIKDEIKNEHVDKRRKAFERDLKGEEIESFDIAANLSETTDNEDDDMEKYLKSEGDDGDGDENKNAASRTKKSEKKKRPYPKPLTAIDEEIFEVKTLNHDDLKREILARRESDKYLHAPYKCDVCYLGFTTEDRKDRHVIKHSEESGPHKCDICHVRMKTGRLYREHMNRQHTMEFMCKLCPMVTRNRAVAVGHMKYHAGSKYKCPQCSVEFEKPTTLQSHLRLKHMSACVCELCGYTFLGEKGLLLHKRITHKLFDPNTKFKGPHCDVCDVKFLTEKAYKLHLRLSSKHITEDDPKRMSNDSSMTPRQFAWSTWVKPVKRPVIPLKNENTPINNEPVTCEQCGVVLENFREYVSHFKYAHPGVTRIQSTYASTPYMCEHCGKFFLYSSTLACHMWVHTGQKLFQCDHCQKSFSMKGRLAYHIRHEHEGARRTYGCPNCSKQFTNKYNLSRHMILHTGLKLFECDKCVKSFSTSGELTAHVKYVHLKRPRPNRVRRKAVKCDMSEDDED